MCKYNGVSEDATGLRLFRWTLKDTAKISFNSLCAGSISTWEEIEAKFLNIFFPLSQTTKLKLMICYFYQ